MSTVRLKTNHKDLGKAGELVSVPFGQGKELIRLGAAEYPTGPVPAGTGKPPTDELAAAKKKLADLEAENAKLRLENAELKQLMDEGDDEKPAGKSPAPAAGPAKK